METPVSEACGNKFCNDPTHVHLYTRASLRTLLEMSCFKDVLITPNYRYKSREMYADTSFNFFRFRYLIRYLMPFPGTTTFPVPAALKRKRTGLFGLGKKAKFD